MSEKQPHSHEHGAEQQANDVEIKARQKELLDDAKKEALEAKNHNQEKLDEIRSEIEETATSANEMGFAEAQSQAEPEVANTYWNSQEYREIAYKQLMTKVRRHLSGPEKTASKVFHQPTIEKISEVGSKTFARPSGVLVGSIFSFGASLITYFMARQNGYDMTYSIFIMSFLGGFMLGVAVEFAYRGVRALFSRS
jgi:hypothetical protein